MEYTDIKIDEHAERWFEYYRPNNELAEDCQLFAYGAQWHPDVIAARERRSEDSLVFNLAKKHLQRVKGKAATKELSLQLLGDSVPPQEMREAHAVLKKLLLTHDNNSAFRKVLNEVYDKGYGAILVRPERDNTDSPMETPALNVIENLKQCFWDVNATDTHKTLGRFCGIVYEVQKDALLSKDLKAIKAKQRSNQQTYKVTDFWYREPYTEDWYFGLDGKWTMDKPANPLMHKQMQNHRVKFMRVIDRNVVIKPMDWYTTHRLPLVYFPGMDTKMVDAGRVITKTIPFVHNLRAAQMLINCAGSTLVSVLKKRGGSKVIVTNSMIAGKEQYWADFLRTPGVIEINESDDGRMEQPLVIPEPPIDPTMVGAMQAAFAVMDQLAGATPAQEGTQASAVSNSGLHTQIMQSDALENVTLANHLSGINEVGRVLKEMIPKVVFEERELAPGMFVNQRMPEHTPSMPAIRNDIKAIFENLDYRVVFGPSSEAEKSTNLLAVKEVMQTNPEAAINLADEFARNLNSSNSDVLERRMQAMMHPAIIAVGKGEMSIEEFQQQREQQQQQQQQAQQQEQDKVLQEQKQQYQQEFGLKEKKIDGDLKLKQAALIQKQDKQQHQAAKDAKGLEIKEFAAVTKAER